MKEYIVGLSKFEVYDYILVEIMVHNAGYARV